MAAALDAPIDEKRLAGAIREATAKVTFENKAGVTFDRQTHEVYVSLAMPGRPLGKRQAISRRG